MTIEEPTRFKQAQLRRAWLFPSMASPVVIILTVLVVELLYSQPGQRYFIEGWDQWIAWAFVGYWNLPLAVIVAFNFRRRTSLVEVCFFLQALLAYHFAVFQLLIVVYTGGDLAGILLFSMPMYAGFFAGVVVAIAIAVYALVQAGRRFRIKSSLNAED